MNARSSVRACARAYSRRTRRRVLLDSGAVALEERAAQAAALGRAEEAGRRCRGFAVAEMSHFNPCILRPLFLPSFSLGSRAFPCLPT